VTFDVQIAELAAERRASGLRPGCPRQCGRNHRWLPLFHPGTRLRRLDWSRCGLVMRAIRTL